MMVNEMHVYQPVLKKRIEKDELVVVYTIFGQMNSIVYTLMYSYLSTVTILFETYFYTTP
ncbi:unnamed protein product [Brassica oleracea var. botrytis]